jgi:DNA repair protein RadC
MDGRTDGQIAIPAWIGELLEESEVERAGVHLLLADLAQLSRSDAAALEAELGLKPASARRLQAAFALARAVGTPTRSRRPCVRTPEAVFELLRPHALGLVQETFWVLLLDGKHRLQRLAPISVGTLTASLVHPREVFRCAIREAAAALIVAHNHPSGDPEPSAEDLAVTERLKSAGELLGVPLLDHVILGEAGFVSLRSRMKLS